MSCTITLTIEGTIATPIRVADAIINNYMRIDEYDPNLSEEIMDMRATELSEVIDHIDSYLRHRKEYRHIRREMYSCQP